MASLLWLAWSKTDSERESARSLRAAEAEDFAARVARSIDPLLRDLTVEDLERIGWQASSLEDARRGRISELGNAVLEPGRTSRETAFDPSLSLPGTRRSSLSLFERETVSRAYESPSGARTQALLALLDELTLSPALRAEIAVDAAWHADRVGDGEGLRSALVRSEAELRAVTEADSSEGAPATDLLVVSTATLCLMHGQRPPIDWRRAIVRLPTDLALGAIARLREGTMLDEADCAELERQTLLGAERARRERATAEITGPVPARGRVVALAEHLVLTIDSGPDRKLLVLRPDELASVVSHQIGQTVRLRTEADRQLPATRTAASGFLVVDPPPWSEEGSHQTEQLLLLGLVLSIAFGAALAWRSNRAEVRAIRREGEFLTMVTHELKTPLTGIRIVAELLADGRVQDAEDRVRWLRRLDGEATRLGMLVENVLDLGRTERGETVHRPTQVLVPELCRGVCAMFEPLASKDGLAVELTVDDDAEAAPAIAIDRDATVQALLNLCDNARKYGKDGGVIEVRVLTGRFDDSRRQRIEVEVRDHGPGIPEDERSTLFDRFQRGRSHQSGHIPGVGLGLYLAKGIVRRDGGTLTIETPTEGDGALFRASWPLPESGEHSLGGDAANEVTIDGRP